MHIYLRTEVNRRHAYAISDYITAVALSDLPTFDDNRAAGGIWTESRFGYALADTSKVYCSFLDLPSAISDRF